MYILVTYCEYAAGALYTVSEVLQEMVQWANLAQWLTKLDIHIH